MEIEFWYKLIIIFHVLVALALIGIVLIQHGKGADMGTGFGSGASGSVFGSRGAASFLSKVTALLATTFFATSILLAVLADKSYKDVDVDGANKQKDTSELVSKNASTNEAAVEKTKDATTDDVTSDDAAEVKETAKKTTEIKTTVKSVPNEAEETAENKPAEENADAETIKDTPDKDTPEVEAAKDDEAAKAEEMNKKAE